MTGKESPNTQKDLLRILPGVLVSIAALIVIFIIVDWGEVFAALRGANYVYLLISLPVYLISYLLRALAWHNLLRREISLWRVFLTMHAGYFLNNVLPFRLGELGRAFLLGRAGLGFWRVFSTILIERAFDMALAAGLLLGTLPFVVGAPQSGPVASIVGIMVLLGLAVLYLLARNQEWAISQFNQLSLRWPIILRVGQERINGFFNGLSALVEFSSFIRVLVWMLSSWATAVLFHFILLRAFIPDTEMLWAAFGMATVSLGVAVPSSPSYVGVYEGAWIGVLSLFDIVISTALAFALVSHLLHVLVTALFGVYALSSEGESLGQLFRKILKQRSNVETL